MEREVAAGISLPHTVAPPSPSRTSPTFKLRFAVATTSPQKSFVEPVGIPLMAADIIDIFATDSENPKYASDFY